MSKYYGWENESVRTQLMKIHIFTRIFYICLLSTACDISHGDNYILGYPATYSCTSPRTLTVDLCWRLGYNRTGSFTSLKNQSQSTERFLVQLHNNEAGHTPVVSIFAQRHQRRRQVLLLLLCGWSETSGGCVTSQSWAPVAALIVSRSVESARNE